MKLPFSTEQFFEVFREYNEAVWPSQVILTGFAILITVLAAIKHKQAGMFAGIILGSLWLWMGIVYQIFFFSDINPAAIVFGILFIAEGFLLPYIIVNKKKMKIGFRLSMDGITGLVFIIFALLIYPLLGTLLGHSYPGSPTFGLPCPTTIFTLGILLWSDKRPPVIILIIPVLWSWIGFMASFTMGVVEDTGLLVAGLLFTGIQISLIKSGKFKTISI